MEWLPKQWLQLSTHSPTTRHLRSYHITSVPPCSTSLYLCTYSHKNFLLLIWFMASSQESAIVLFVGCCLATKSFQWVARGNIHLSYTPQTEQRYPSGWCGFTWVTIMHKTFSIIPYILATELCEWGWQFLNVKWYHGIVQACMSSRYQTTSHWSWYEASWNLKPCLFCLLAYSGSNKQYMVEVKWNWIKLAVSGLNCPHTLTTELRDYWEQPPAHNLVGLQLTDL